MMKKKILIVFTIFYVAFVAFNLAEASNAWYRIDRFTEKNKGSYFIEVDGIKQKLKVVTFWTKIVDPDKSQMLTRLAINCEEGEFQFLDILQFDSSGNISDQDSVPSRQWRGIPPEGFFADLQFFFCEGNKLRAIDKTKLIIMGVREILLKEKKR